MEDAPDQAQKILDIVEMKYANGELEEGPDVFTYNTLIGCWAKSKRQDAAEKALNILQGMISRYKSGTAVVCPNYITYYSVINVFAKSGDVDGCQRIFNMMKRDYKEGNKSPKPDIIAYNTLLDAWSNSGMEGAPDQAQKILDIVEMKFPNNGELEDGSDICVHMDGENTEKFKQSRKSRSKN
jgi:pentatricopeptide repeat protein